MDMAVFKTLRFEILKKSNAAVNELNLLVQSLGSQPHLQIVG